MTATLDADPHLAAWPAAPPSRHPGPVHPSRIFRTLVSAALLAAGLVAEPGFALALVGLFVLVVPFERLAPRHRQPLRRAALGTDLAWAVSAPALAVVGGTAAAVIGVLSVAWLPGLALRPLVTALPPTAHLVAAVLLFELAGYWAHRLAHEVPFLWRFHAIHHSTRHLDWVSGLRVHPLDGVLVAPPFAFLLGAGVSPEVSGALAAVQLVVGIFLHANVRWRLRPLQPVVATPEFHHWHHADEPEAHHTNYGGFLPLWDLVFGTYRVPADRRPTRYGVSEPVPDDFVGQLRHPVRGLPGPGVVLRHPVRTACRLVAATRRGLDQSWQAATRPTHRAR